MDTPKLPRKMSELLMMAVEDAQKIERTPGYVLDMGDYHTPWKVSEVEECHVCMAGAVMSCRLGITRDQDVRPADFDLETDTAMMAIDSMRKGWFGGAAQLLGVRPDDLTVLDRASEAVGYYRDTGGAYNKLGRSAWDCYVSAADVLASFGL